LMLIVFATGNGGDNEHSISGQPSRFGDTGFSHGFGVRGLGAGARPIAGIGFPCADVSSCVGKLSVY
jgi:hypothetical protein